MDQVAVSVVIPVYNVEEYLERAIESICRQTLKRWELYLVDDGSKDRSGAICDRYASKDDRIHVIHQENGGAPSARNHAIPLLKGEYTFFMDADDWCEKDMLLDLYGLAGLHRADLVVCGYEIDTFYGNGKKDYIRTPMAPDSLRVYTKKADFREDAHLYFDRNLLYTPWNKLYKTSVIRDNGLFFPNTQWDDFPFNLSVIEHVDRVVVSPERYYHFLRARSESESEKYIPHLYEKREEEHGWMIRLYRHWHKTTNPGIINRQDVKEFVSRRYIERLIGCFENLTNPRASEKNRFRIFYAMHRMLDNPRVKAALRYARPRSRYMQWMLWPVKHKAVWALTLEMRFISFVKMHFVWLFALLKSHR